MVGFIVKVFLASGLIAIAIKYAAPFLAISGTNAIALTLVLSPTILMAIALGWRWQQSTHSDSDSRSV
jgi:spore maturation protein SpmB